MKDRRKEKTKERQKKNARIKRVMKITTKETK